MQTALRYHPNFADACNNLASVHAQMGDVQQAVEYYNQALRIDPTLVDVLQNLGDLLLLQGAEGQAQAQEYFQRALRLAPDCARAWRGLGDAMRETGQHSKAVAFYTQVSSLHAKVGRMLTILTV